MEYKNYPTVCCVAVTCKNKILLIRRGNPDTEGYNKWAFPGGFQEGDKPTGQSLHEVALRELAEETGLELDFPKMRVICAETDEYNHNVIIFRIELEEFPNNCNFACDPYEIKEVRWVNELDWSKMEGAFPLHNAVINDLFDSMP